MGMSESEPGYTPNEGKVRVRIGRTFSISAQEVTKAQYRTFQQAVKGFNPEIEALSRYYVLTDDTAQVGLKWYDAAHYCDWLSGQEKIPRKQWCYDPTGGVYGPGMKPKDKFWELKGYRLPTQAEWEFACRAGTVTSRYYGMTDQLLPHYAWVSTNSKSHLWPTGTLEPNDSGLFDMLGNASELCLDRLDRSREKDQLFDDTPTIGPVEDTGVSATRGGSFNSSRSDPVSGRRSGSTSPAARISMIGFRPARTGP
jgi:formylglycine-generating enzyme required for sulfatase activity